MCANGLYQSSTANRLVVIPNTINILLMGLGYGYGYGVDRSEFVFVINYR